MIRIHIGTASNLLQHSSPSWITEQIRLRQEDGQSVCVRVEIAVPDVNFTLATPACPGGRDGAAEHTAREERVLDLWRELRLNESSLVAGRVVAFVQRLRHVLDAPLGYRPAG